MGRYNARGRENGPWWGGEGIPHNYRSKRETSAHVSHHHHNQEQAQARENQMKGEAGKGQGGFTRAQRPQVREQ